MKKLLTLISGLFFVLALSACGGDGGGGTGGAGGAGATTLNAVLSGAQQVPPVTTASSGSANFTVAADGGSIDFTLNASGFTSPISAAHIHRGDLGENGSVLFTLVETDFTAGTGSGAASGTLTAPDAGVALSMAEAVSLILAGGTYVNVHTQANAAGEIRGQLGAQQINAVLSGDQETAAVVTPASGSFSLSIPADQSSAEFSLTVSGFTVPITAAHIHNGALGTNGPVLITLTEGDFTGTLSGTISDVDPGVTLSLGDVFNLILSGDAYVNVHTAQNAAGEIRGQLGPQTLTVSLSGDQEVPPVVTPATGSATLNLNARQDAIDFTLSITGNTTAVSASHIHVGAAGENGGVMVTLVEQDFTTTSGTVTAPDNPAARTFAEVVNLVLSGGAYINVHTTANAAGEIRGQLGP